MTQIDKINHKEILISKILKKKTIIGVIDIHAWLFISFTWSISKVPLHDDVIVCNYDAWV